MGNTLALAFSAGLVAAVNPCGFALLPAYLSYYLGLDATADAEGVRPAPGEAVFRAVKVGLAVTAGFVVVFGVLGIVWSSISALIAPRLGWITIVLGLGVIILGIAMLFGFQPTVNLPKLNLSREGRQVSSMFLYGAGYAVASLSCTIPIFIGLVVGTARSGGFMESLLAFVMYALGMGLVITILTLATALARGGIVRALRRVLPYIGRISGGLLILAGAFVIVWGWDEVQVERGNLNAGGIADRGRDLQDSIIAWVSGVGEVRLGLALALVVFGAIGVAAVLRWDARVKAKAPAAADASRAPTPGAR